MTILEAFENSYVATALWSSFDGESFDVADIDSNALAQMAADCSKFYNENQDAILSDGAPMGETWDGATDDERKASMAGHDFWLTRCGHGAGFWDGDWQEPHATQLTKVSEAFGNVDLYDVDGVVYS